MKNKSLIKLSFFLVILMVVNSIILNGAKADTMKIKTETATFAGGCFWGIEKLFSEIDGVIDTKVGYTGGKIKNPSYERVCTGLTGHAESIEITFDPSKLSYKELLETFFSYHDPTTVNRQGNDVGTQYRSAIFYHDESQERTAKKAVELLIQAKVFKDKIVTSIEPASEFYAAEDYHQKYLKKNPNGYCHIHFQSHKIHDVLQKLT